VGLRDQCSAPPKHTHTHTKKKYFIELKSNFINNQKETKNKKEQKKRGKYQKLVKLTTEASPNHGTQ
jgi:hypothetical protein